MQYPSSTFQVVAAVIASAVAGTLVVSYVLVFPILIEAVERFEYAMGGGRGDEAYWDESLFYVVLMPIHYFLPWGAIGAAVGGLFGWWIARRT